MMKEREIKFRAWSPRTKIMSESFTLMDALTGRTEGADFKGAILMQFTGLVDKKGKKSYEGDIVAFEESVMSDMGEDKPNYIKKGIEPNFEYVGGEIGERRYGQEIKVVEWRESSCGFEPFSDSNENCGHCGGGDESKRVEVIGNTYENKNLLFY